MNETQPVVFEDIRIDVPWGFVEGRWYGNRQVRPILAIHGWQDNLGTWDRLVPLMPQDIGVLCIDLPGHGRSSKYPLGVTYHVIDYVHIILRIIKEYKWSKVSLMGHSLGAIVCYYYAALYPEMVDMLIQIDLIKSKYRALQSEISLIGTRVEKLMLENERLEQMHMNEPPSYSYQELEDALFKGSGTSVTRDNCKHLLNRSIANTKKFPNKFYFSRDPRIKYYVGGPSEHGLGLEMAKRIQNIGHIIVRSDKQSFMQPLDEEIVQVLELNNPNFEYHLVQGTHHLHLNNPELVAQLINPFIIKQRLLLLDKWSMDDNPRRVNQEELISKL